jgi:hypothetical protein
MKAHATTALAIVLVATLCLMGCVPGPAGPTGPPGPPGPSGLSEAYTDLNFQDEPLAPFPGIFPAALNLPPGQYIVHAKLRLRNVGGSTGNGSCVFEPSGTSGLDSTGNMVLGLGQEGGGTLLATSNGGQVRLQCIGTPQVHVINSELIAIKIDTLHAQ